MDSNGYVEMTIQIGTINTKAKLWILENLCTGIILGLDWLTSEGHKATINFNTNSLSISSNEQTSYIPLLKINMDQQYRVRICEKFILNPMEERIVEIKVIDLPNCDTAQFSPTPHFLYQDSLLMPHALINVKNYKGFLTIMNISNRPRIINKNTPVGIVETESHNSSCFSISSSTSSSTSRD